MEFGSPVGAPMPRRAGQRIGAASAAALLAALVIPAIAAAHIERASYWPDPKPDCSISPCAGGEVLTARSLASAVNTVVAPTCSSRGSVRLSLRGPKGQRLRSVKIYVN